MRCFSGRSIAGGVDASRPPRPSSLTLAGSSGDDDGHGINGEVRTITGRSRDRSPLSQSSVTSTSAVASSAASPSSATINLSREYTHAINTNSFKEIWSAIQPPRAREREENEEREGDEENSSASTPGDGASPYSSSRLIGLVLQPDQASIEEALRAAPPTRLTRLVSDYFDSSEHTSHFCLSLCDATHRARSLYAPITELINLFPAADGCLARLTNNHCDWAFDRLLEFDCHDNPFPVPSGSGSCSFQGMRGRFSDLKQQLELRLLKARRRHRMIRRVKQGSGACLVITTVGLVVTGVVLATHALVMLMAAPAFCLGRCRLTRHLLEGSRPRLKDYISQLDAASRGAYVLNNDLATIDRLVDRLYRTVESDRVVVRLGLESGRGQQHPIEEVVRQLRKNYPSFLSQLKGLEEHICLFLLALKRARSLLLEQILQQPTGSLAPS